MDVKAMARSKRSHSKHHQPRKPHRPTTHSISSSSLSNDPKAVKEEGERNSSTLSSSLPSNWDRYDNSEEDDGLLGSDSSVPKTDVVMPKSKGADFSILVSEAKSQSPANFSDSFDAIFPDFSQGLGSMLSVRGENILSWTGGDNFLMDDDAATHHEVPFLSLNLQTLAEDLARIDLAQRLFIEEDILPPELLAPQKDERDSMMPVSASVEQRSKVDNLAFQNSSEAKEGRTMCKEGPSLRLDSADSTNQTPWSFRQERQLDNKLAAHLSNSLRNIDPTESFKATEEAKIDKRMPKFEADLDMLLDSFNETKFVGSTNAKKNCASLGNEATWNDLRDAYLSSSGNNLDNDIDDLLEETSYSAVGHTTSHSLEVNADSAADQLSSSLHIGTKCNVMEDFDSWLDSM